VTIAVPRTVHYHEIERRRLVIAAPRCVPGSSRTSADPRFRVEWGGRSVAYVSDHQQPHDGTFSVTRGVRELVDNVDLLIHDSSTRPPSSP